MTTNWLRELKDRLRGRKTRPIRRDRRPTKLFVEPLEARVVPTVTINVTTTADTVEAADGVTSLREAVIQANAVSAGEDVFVNLPFTGGTFNIARSTIQFGGIGDTEFNSQQDPLYGDFDVRRSMSINCNGSFIRGERLGRVFQISGDVDVDINQATILNGGDVVSQGGGMHVSGGADVSLSVVTFFNNTTAFSSQAAGGAIYANNPGGSVTMYACEFSSNAARGGSGEAARGGAIYLDGGRLEINSSEFKFNTARGGDGGSPGAFGGRASGGAIHVEIGDLVIQTTFGADPVFVNNRAEGGDGAAGSSTTAGGYGGTGRGGAVYYDGGGTLSVSRTVFENNTADGGRGGASEQFVSGGSGGDAYGGAVFLGSHGFTVNIQESEFRDNRAFAWSGGRAGFSGGDGGTARGGAIATDNAAIDFNSGFFSTIAIARTVIDDNRALGGRGGDVTVGVAGAGGDAYGGAIYAKFSSLDIADTTIRTNEAMAGDGGYAEFGQAGDGGVGSGGAIYTGGYVPLTLTGTLDSEVTETGNPDDLRATGLLFGNAVYGGTGGRKFNVSAGSDEDEPGRGGNAQGGAIAAESGAPLSVNQILFHSNIAMSGNGGFGSRTGSNPGTRGGHNGDAYGGAIYTTTDTTLDTSSFVDNLAVGARLDLIDSSSSDTQNADALTGGAGGRDEDGAGLRGGNGGFAYGGAVFATRALTVANSGFTANKALGGMGGAGGAGGDDNDGGRGGAGGFAHGGAIRAETEMPITISRSVFLSNYVQGGRGGSGGKGGLGSQDGFAGGAGGTGGDAVGGAISIENPYADEDGNLTSVILSRVYAIGNMAIAGDAGFAGNGGAGAEFGGTGGSSAIGGHALGGGVHLESTDTTIDRSTIERNVVSSGFGAVGGYGGGGGVGGGTGGRGSAAGAASGGGIAQIEGELTISRSTIVLNHVASGFGGHGGFGGFGKQAGGSGGNGGNGGDARGGGIYYSADNPQPINVTTTTIARNVLDAGGAGFAGPAGRGLDQMNGSVPIRYDAAPGQTIISGAAGVLSGRLSNGAGNLTANYTITSDTAAAGLGADSLAAGPFALADVSGYLGVEAALIGSFGAGVVIGIIAAIETVQVGGGGILLVGQTAVAATTTAVTFTAGTAFTVGGAIFAGGAVLAIGVGVLTKAIVAGAMSGDWEAAFQYALGTPGEAHPRDFGVLLYGGQESEDDPGIPLPPEDGVAGTNGEAEGTGIWGSARLSRTIVSDNEAFERTRTRRVSTLSTGYGRYLVSETITQRSRADVANGPFFSDGTNFIGAVEVDLPDELQGTVANPLSAKLDTQTRFNGGSLPTMKLLPGSPARRAISTGSTTASQNDYIWGDVVDIGAWGGAPNRAPDAVNGPFSINEDNALTVPIGSDWNGDQLQLVGPAPTAEHGVITVNGSEITYTPEANWFGQETLTYQVTDGEFTTTVTTVINVLPVNDRPVPQLGHLTIDEDEVKYIDLWDYVTDIDTPKELLRFAVVNGGGTGTAVLLPDGHTVKFTPRANYHGSLQSFEYYVTDPGAGAGPVYQNLGEAIFFTVLPVNDAPVNTLPAAPAVDEDADLVLSGVSVSDVDDHARSAAMRVTLSVGQGTLTLSQTADLTFSEGDGAADMTTTFTGTLAAVNAALASMTYKPSADFNGVDQLRIVSNDLGNFGAGGARTTTDVVAITINAVNDAPTNTVPGPQSGYEDVPLTVTGISVADLDAGESTGLIEVTLSVAYGTMTLGRTDGLTFVEGDGAGDGTMTFRGTPADINAALSGMSYLGNLDFSGEDTLTIFTSDLGNTGAGGPLTTQSTIAITVESAQQQADALAQRVNELQEQGVLSKGHAIWLLALLDLNGNDGDVSKIQIFIRTIQFRFHRTLTPEQVNSLVGAASILLASVSNSDR